MKYKYFVNGVERFPTKEERRQLSERFIEKLGYKKEEKLQERKKAAR